MSRRRPRPTTPDQPSEPTTDARAPWPWHTQATAARRLGVTVEYLTGMANNPLPAVKDAGRTGATVWLFQAEAIDALTRRLTRDTPS